MTAKLKKYSLYKNTVLTDDFIKVKHHGKIYTPDYLVKIILDRGGYTGKDILHKHVIENSCGDGQFLIQVVDRYCQEYLQASQDLVQLRTELETYIHAIELDQSELNLCQERCDKVAQLYGITDVKWNFLHADTTQTTEFDGRMDFVVGNPPYVRIHNLDNQAETVKNHLFCQSGMTDLYILFYEIGIRMLNPHGTLAYIAPSSFFTSLAGAEMRNYLIEHNLLSSVCDLKHFQAFNSTTYTAIVCLKKHQTSNTVDYAEFDSDKMMPKKVSELKPEDYFIDGKYYFSDRKSLAWLRVILNTKTKSGFAVKNGYATLADKVFVQDFQFTSKYIIPVIKASRGTKSQIFYPYDENGKLFGESELFQDANIKKYLLANKTKLLNRSSEKAETEYWYAFGRSQAINDTYKDKLSLNTLVREPGGVKIIDAPSGTGVYSGLYIISDTIPTRTLKTLIQGEEFYKYVSLLGKYKSGGYCTYSSKDVTIYLNYQLSKEKHADQ